MTTVTRDGDMACVVAGGQYAPHVANKNLCMLQDTGNGFIAYFPSYSPAYQDRYICMDYTQAADMILAFSAFKRELGFV